MPKFTSEQVQAAIQPYLRRIRELEEMLEAVGAGGVTQGVRMTQSPLAAPITEKPSSAPKT